MAQPLRRRRRRPGLWPVVAGILIRIGLVCAGLAVILFVVGELDRARLESGVRPTTGSRGAGEQARTAGAPEVTTESIVAAAPPLTKPGALPTAPLGLAPMAAPSPAPSDESRSTPLTPSSGAALSLAALLTPSPTANEARVGDEGPVRLGFAAPPAGYESVSMHVAPSTSAARVTSVPTGEAVQLLGQSATGDGYAWARVRSGDGREGWLIAGALRVPD
jgi:hypothetical protein